MAAGVRDEDVPSGDAADGRSTKQPGGHRGADRAGGSPDRRRGAIPINLKGGQLGMVVRSNERLADQNQTVLKQRGSLTKLAFCFPAPYSRTRVTIELSQAVPIVSDVNETLLVNHRADDDAQNPVSGGNVNLPHNGRGDWIDG